MEDPKKLMQEASGYLRKAENNMFGGKNHEAVELLTTADELTEKAAQQVPDDFQIKSLRQKIEKMRKDLERKGIATRPGSGGGLPFEVEAQLGHIRESILSKDLSRAKRELDNYYARFAGPHTDIPQIKEMHMQIQVLEKDAEAAEIRKASEKLALAESLSANEALCREWEAEFRSIPYFGGTAHNVPGLLDEKQYFIKAKEVIERYSKVRFSAEKSITLENFARDVAQRINEFEANFDQTAAEMAGEILRDIEESIDFLNRDTAWVHQPELKPHFTGRRELEAFSSRIDEIQPLFDENAAPFEKLKHAYSQLLSMNEERKAARSKRITMRPAVVAGPEADEAIREAGEVLLKIHSDAKVLKASVVKEWEQKRTENWLDNTRTQWVVRNFLETSVELAAQYNGSNHSLFCMHVQKDINNDGTYGKISSHLMFEEMMAAENIS